LENHAASLSSPWPGPRRLLAGFGPLVPVCRDRGRGPCPTGNRGPRPPVERPGPGPYIPGGKLTNWRPGPPFPPPLRGGGGPMVPRWGAGGPGPFGPKQRPGTRFPRFSPDFSRPARSGKPRRGVVIGGRPAPGLGGGHPTYQGRPPGPGGFPVCRVLEGGPTDFFSQGFAGPGGIAPWPRRPPRGDMGNCSGALFTTHKAHSREPDWDLRPSHQGPGSGAYSGSFQKPLPLGSTLVRPRGGGARVVVLHFWPNEPRKIPVTQSTRLNFGPDNHGANQLRRNGETRPLGKNPGLLGTARVPGRRISAP